MKHVIWSNIDLNIEDWKEDFAEFLADNNSDKNPNDEDALYNYMIETNNEYLSDEILNLDKCLDGRILCVADLGLWNGRRQGYKILGTNINTIFNVNSNGFDYAEFYGDGYNIRGTEYHHDGKNNYMFRVIREDRNINNLLDDIYYDRKVSNDKMNFYTKSLYKKVASIYGWR